MTRGPILIDLEDSKSPPAPDQAPPVPESGEPDLASGRAMQAVTAFAARRPSRLVKWFWSLLMSLLAAVLSVTAWDFVTGLIARSPVLGYGVAALAGLFLLVLGGIVVRELAGFARLGRIDSLNRSAVAALAAEDLAQARDVIAGLTRLYKGREDTRWGRDRMRQYAPEQFDSNGLLGLAEGEIMTPLDAAAIREVEAAARQVAMVTALVPLAMADVVAALSANVRMIRRVAEIYGGRAGLLGSWRLARAVMAHLVATGAVAIGDDMIGSLAGGGILSKLSRRFGEGVVNGALTARVGMAAMEVCRPLPFIRAKRPSVTGVVKRALAGLFGQG